MASKTKYSLSKDVEADNHENGMYRNGRNGRANKNGKANSNGHYGKLNQDFNDESDKVNRCLRIANPIILGLAFCIMFTTVFCILYYGVINGKGLLNPWAKEIMEVPESTADALYTCDPPCDVANSYCGEEGSCLCEQDFSPVYSETDAERLVKCVVSKMMTPSSDKNL